MSRKLTSEEMHSRLMSNYYMNNPDANFTKDVEETYEEFSLFSPKLKGLIHSQAWERGHSSGHHEVFYQYDDLLKIAICAIRQTRKCVGCESCVNPCGKEDGHES